MNLMNNLLLITTFFLTFNFYSFHQPMMALVTLSTFISIMMNMASKKIKKPSLYMMTNLILLTVVIIFFTTNSLITLYITFELSLFPTLILIMKWGQQPERLQASYYFVLYTIFASLPLIISILTIYKKTFYLNTISPLMPLSFNMNFIMSMAMMTAFMVKLPTWGMHLWLPKAHVEAPIAGSMILAGILLKLGGWGLMKIIYILPMINKTATFFYMSLNLIGAMLVGLVCLQSTDMKVLIAYSSIIHMNMMTTAMMTKTNTGMMGALAMMISHGFTSPGMFALANHNYEKTKSRSILINSSTLMTSPEMNMMWFFMITANMATPPSLNLLSEIFISMSLLSISNFMFLPMFTITMLGAAYNLFLYSSMQSNNTNFIMPFKKNESINFLTLMPLMILPYMVIMLTKILC